MRVLNDHGVDSSADQAPSGRNLQAMPNAADWDVVAGADAGTGVIIGCAVTLHSGGTAVDVAAGIIAVNGFEYLVSATANIAITNGDATNARIDQVLVAAGTTNGGASGTPAITTGVAAILAAQKSLSKNADNTPSVVELATLTVIAGATTIATTDIVDKRAILTNRPLASGWTCDANAVTRTGSGASNVKSSFTQAVDGRRRYRRGTPLRWYESGTEKFGYVATDSTFSSGTLTVTLPGNIDYWMAATPDYGVVFFAPPGTAPDGFPVEFNYTPTWTGFSTAPALGIGCFRYYFAGKECTAVIEPATAGTSNAITATTKTVTMPDGVTALKQTGGTTWFATAALDGVTGTNFPSVTNPCPWTILTGTNNIITIYRDTTLAKAWQDTNTGSPGGSWTARFRLTFTAA